jgi:uncharacterized membrane protein YkvA (DUF1232 family)
MTTKDIKLYGNNYSEIRFWNKIYRGICLDRLERELIENALILFYAISNASLEKKSIIIGALGYFILPMDLIPDLIPVVGFTDDANLLAFAIREVRSAITTEVTEKAKKASELVIKWWKKVR